MLRFKKHLLTQLLFDDFMNRLAFHDCMPYEDGGGCDGCLSFEANEDEHNVLQHSVAILVIIFYS